MAASFAAAYAFADYESIAVAAAVAMLYFDEIAVSGDLDWADETFLFLNFVDPLGVISAWLFAIFIPRPVEFDPETLWFRASFYFLSLGLTNLQVRLFMIDSLRSCVQKKLIFSGSSFSWKSHQKRFLNRARTII